MFRFVWRILIGILILLNVAVFLNGIGLSCDECKITFQNSHVSGIKLSEPLIIAEIPITEIYNDFEQGYCSIKWDRVQGYYK